MGRPKPMGRKLSPNTKGRPYGNGGNVKKPTKS